jgi:GNAT superfamily N-acetyltransferase
MHIEQADPADAQTIRACHEVLMAVLHIDEPHGPWPTERPFGGWLAVGWGGDPREVWLARAAAGGPRGVVPPEASGAGGPVAGWYRLELPDLENLDRASLDLFVRPEDRRRGIGRALLRHAAGRARAHGRSVMTGATRNGSAGEAFARAVNASPVLVDVQRMMETGKLEEAELARLRREAERAAAGYSLVSWTGPVPEELIEQAADLYTALNDAPHSPGSAPSRWDAQRVRERFNDLQPRFGLRDYSVAARHDASGELAALTQVGVDPADPAWGSQMITAVVRKHRGHRLGLLVKIAMLDLLATAEPQVERIVTWNAEANKHMIAVNEALGYTILGQLVTDWEIDPALVAAR